MSLIQEDSISFFFCIACPSKCLRCNLDEYGAIACTHCITGYGPTSLPCVPCDSSLCLKCYYDEGNMPCALCKKGYYAKEGLCVCKYKKTKMKYNKDCLLVSRGKQTRDYICAVALKVFSSLKQNFMVVVDKSMRTI